MAEPSGSGPRPRRGDHADYYFRANANRGIEIGICPVPREGLQEIVDPEMYNPPCDGRNLEPDLDLDLDLHLDLDLLKKLLNFCF